jgi:hypothetical protein
MIELVDALVFTIELVDRVRTKIQGATNHPLSQDASVPRGVPRDKNAKKVEDYW